MSCFSLHSFAGWTRTLFWTTLVFSPRLICRKDLRTFGVQYHCITWIPSISERIRQFDWHPTGEYHKKWSSMVSLKLATTLPNILCCCYHWNSETFSLFWNRFFTAGLVRSESVQNRIPTNWNVPKSSWSVTTFQQSLVVWSEWRASNY